MSFDLYQHVTDQILAMLDAGTVPWRSPILGKGTAGMPKNLVSRKGYRGVNVFLLAFARHMHGYESSFWATYCQMQELGGQVRKGERSQIVVFWKLYETEDRQTHQPTTVPVLRYFNVFNCCQVDGIEPPDAVKYEPTHFEPIQACEQIVAGYEGRPQIVHGGGQALYRPSTDTVHIPEPRRFTSAEEYYGTLFHEFAHSSGSSDRLDRGLDTNPAPFGSASYGKEELIAETAAAFLAAHAGISPPTIANSAAYIAGWQKTIKADKKLVIAAAGAGQKAADWIRGERQPPAD